MAGTLCETVVRQIRMRRPASAAETGSPPLVRKTGVSRGQSSRLQPAGSRTGAPSLIGTHDLVEVCRLLHVAVARQMDATIFFLGLYDDARQTGDAGWHGETE